MSSGNEAPPNELRLGAIDIGSNSVRLVVAQALAAGGYRVLDEERENTRLATDLARTGQLNGEAMEATLATLARFNEIVAGHGAQRIRAIATSAVRDARNGAEFCQRVRDQMGLTIEVISGQEEARLAFLSVARAFDVAGKEVAVVDIGGGSTEIVLASSGLIDEVYATRLGAVRITERCQLADRTGPLEVAAAERFVDKQLKKHARKPPFVPSMLYGTGGTFTAMANILSARVGDIQQPLRGYRVKRAAIHHLLTDLAGMSLEDRTKVPGLNPRRADIIVAGLLIIERVMRHLGVNVVQVHTRGVRDGLLLDMLESGQQRTVTSDERQAAINQFADSCGVDSVHAMQTARIAAQLFDELAIPLGIDPLGRELLVTSAQLANVGYLINYDGHHKHSYQLILHSELPGFERRQLQLLACIARYHRGRAPKKSHPGYRDLNEADQRLVAQLASLLRLALALDRTHQQQVQHLVGTVSDGQVVLQVAAKHNADVDIWAARRKVDLFERTFGRQVVIESRRPIESA
jgi:exopolyphosphatase / guanosine-5'-triphosphate,3'-diphosphate pyrophosphatase